MAIKKKFIHFKKKESFQRELDAGNILNTSIVFIADAKQIYLNGTYFSENTLFNLSELLDNISGELKETDTVNEAVIKLYKMLSNDTDIIKVLVQEINDLETNITERLDTTDEVVAAALTNLNQTLEKQKLEIITYNGEEINPKKDFAVIMNDGSLYIERNIDWSKKVVDFWGKKAIDLHTDRNLFSSEYAPKFSKILSLGDLSPADGIRMYALWHIKLPYCYPWGRPKVLGLIKSDIPEGSNLSEDYLEYQMNTVKIPPKFNFTYNGPSNSFEFLNCDFTECEYATDTLDYEEGDICSVHLNLPVDGKGAIRFYGSKFDNLYTINCKNIDKITNYQTLMFNNCEIKNFPAFHYPRGEAGNHIMDPENPTATHTNHPWCNNWKFTSLTDANSLFAGLKYVGPDPDKLIMDFSVFNFVNATGAWRCYAELGNMPHIQIYHPKLANPAYDIFRKDDKTKTLIITEVGPNCNAVWGGLPLALEHIEMNLRNAANFGTPNDIYTAKILLLYHLKCNCNISNFPLIGDDSVERTLTYLQTVTNKTFTLNTNTWNRIINQNKFKELIYAAQQKGWTITYSTTDEADKVYKANYDAITSRLSKAEDDVKKLEEQKDSMKTTINAHESSINTLEQNVSNLTTQVDSIEPYTLPVANFNTLGGIKGIISSVDTDEYSKVAALWIDGTGKPYFIVKDDFTITNRSTTYRFTPFIASSGGDPSGFNIDFYLYTFDGSRTISTTATNLVQEQGLAKVLQSYPKLTNGKIPTQYLPSSVYDVLEFPVLEAFPTFGETHTIYVDTTENRIYRWSGTQYTEIAKSLALGETSSTAYAGDKGAANAAKVINLEENLNKAISDIAIYPFDGFTNSFDNETSRPNGTILWGPSGFKIKVNGEWTDNQSDLPNYIKPGLGGGNVRNDRLFRYNNLLYRFDALGNIGNTLIPIVPLATDETHGIIKVNGVTDNINKSIYTNSDGEIGISIGNSNIKGISRAAAEELGYGNISFDTDSTSLTPDVNIYVYDGTRNLVSTSNNLIAEKGLVKALEPYVKIVEGKDLSSNDYTDADKTKLTGLREYTLATNSDIDAIING